MESRGVIVLFVVALVASSATSGVALAGGASTLQTPADLEPRADVDIDIDRPSDRPATLEAGAASDDARRIVAPTDAPVRRDVVPGVPGGGKNFTDEVLLTERLDDPMELTFLPDGRMLVVQREGVIWITDPDDGTTNKTVYMKIAGRVNTSSEHGFEGIALDPNFRENRYVYLYYSNDDTKRNRISRFTHREADGDLLSYADPSSETVIWEQPSKWDHCCHVGGGLDFGPDGKLYLTTGMDLGGNSQNLSSAEGKVIRINKDGSIPSDNPFVDDPDALDSVWAYGLRAPFRAEWDQKRERFMIGDVGGEDRQTSMEEINVGEVGANYGWPMCEGPCAVQDTRDPFIAYPQESNTTYTGLSIIGGDVYYGDQFPEEYHGAYFFADFVHGWMRFLTFHPNGSVDQNRLFANETEFVTDVAVGPDGALYYTSYDNNAVHRIEYTDPLMPRVQEVSVNQQSGPAPLQVDFSATATVFGDGPVTYTWTFGDGTQAKGASVTHTYEQNGVYRARLSVAHGNHTAEVGPIVIEVGAPLTTVVVPPETESPGQPGFGLALTSLALLVAALLATRRR